MARRVFCEVWTVEIGLGAEVVLQFLDSCFLILLSSLVIKPKSISKDRRDYAIVLRLCVLKMQTSTYKALRVFICEVTDDDS